MSGIMDTANIMGQDLIAYIHDNFPDSYVKIEVIFRTKNFSYPEKLVDLGNFTMLLNGDKCNGS
jgi:hypothetical protein